MSNSEDLFASTTSDLASDTSQLLAETSANDQELSSPTPSYRSRKKKAYRYRKRIKDRHIAEKSLFQVSWFSTTSFRRSFSPTVTVINILHPFY